MICNKIRLRKRAQMNKKGPIIVIEDDADDRDVLSAVFKELNYPNEIVFFEDGDTALEYLKDEKVYPFLILSDINLPRLNGFELRKMVHTNEGLSEKCIPYLFFSTSVDKKAVYDAYTMSVQGFFVKPNNYAKITHTMKVIIEYWQECYSPNNFEH
jgi:CheY-like chemotaxis protein